MTKIESIKGVYVLTDSRLVEPRSLIEVMKMVIEGGATAIQLRDKTASDRSMIVLGKKLMKLTAGKIPLIVNDRIDVALAIGADGVHVGQNDTPAIKAKKMIGENMILGVSASTVAQAIEAQKAGADYLGVGPIFPTVTKTDADHPIGTEGLLAIKRAVSIPVVAIGGINAANAHTVAKIADGIAVISAVMGAKNPEKATRELSIICNRSKMERIIL